jgi:hypothetical protein
LYTYLGTVDELGQRNIGMVSKNMDILETACGAILELDAQEVTDIRRRTTAEFNGKSGCVISYFFLKKNVSVPCSGINQDY